MHPTTPYENESQEDNAIQGDMYLAKQILLKHAEKNSDGFTAGQIRWIVDAMIEFAELTTKKN